MDIKNLQKIEVPMALPERRLRAEQKCSGVVNWIRPQGNMNVKSKEHYGMRYLFLPVGFHGREWFLSEGVEFFQTMLPERALLERHASKIS